MNTRKERRLHAKETDTTFIPQYKSGQKTLSNGVIMNTGGNPKTHQEMFKVGYERFNNKFVTIKEVPVEEVQATE